MSDLPLLIEKAPGQVVTAAEWNQLLDSIKTLGDAVAEFTLLIETTVANEVTEKVSTDLITEDVLTDIATKLGSTFATAAAVSAISQALTTLTNNVSTLSNTVSTQGTTLAAIPTTYEKKIKRVSGNGALTLGTDELGIRY